MYKHPFINTLVISLGLILPHPGHAKGISSLLCHYIVNQLV